MWIKQKLLKSIEVLEHGQFNIIVYVHVPLDTISAAFLRATNTTRFENRDFCKINHNSVKQYIFYPQIQTIIFSQSLKFFINVRATNILSVIAEEYHLKV